MLTASGVKLADFGLAKLRDAEYEDNVEKPTKSLELAKLCGRNNLEEREFSRYSR
jgi:hypothetical protein